MTLNFAKNDGNPFLLTSQQTEFNFLLGLSQEVISKPDVLCKDIPYSRHGDNICQENVASLSLKWQTTFEVAGNQVVYVISAREMDSTIDEPKEWQVLQTVSILINPQNRLRV